MEPGLVEDRVDRLNTTTQVRVGTSGWSYPSWIGPFYPPSTPASRMLAAYAGHFGTVEAHSTHRRMPTVAALQRWAAQVPAEFRFAPKAHASITHRRDLDGLAERTAAFFAALAPLGDRLGPVLFVVPHRRLDLARLDALLAALPAHPPAVFELAPAWRTEAVLSRLDARSASLAVVDRGDGPIGAQAGSGPVAYVRLRRPRYGDAELDAWAGWLAAAATAGREVYAFVRHDEEGTGPRYARDLVRRLEEP